ncbi:hypothetical protein B0H66DRAFT_614036 [Apodospora peruviana]|uniref:BZIP domain-containing protein n=1 Tax=Apodospora peruviana TaxID=516989 RepID=A0AAE0IUI6_9PEZI|nr:hypothetical protein B0H66DRAFT_614036 [Apodospora peruviana]
MHSAYLDADHYHHDSSPPSSTTVLTGPHSTPTSSLLDGTLVFNHGDSLFPDHSVLTPQSATGSSVNLVPGLTLPKTTSGKRGRPPASESGSASPAEEVIVKRQRNNLAAKKYRQKKIDRIQELEEEVDDVKKERDELRIRLARQEAETAALREMLKMASRSSSSES